MSSYDVDIEPRVIKALRSIPVTDQRRVLERIRGLGDDPRPAGALKVEGQSGTWRVRQGDYRIFYWIDDERSVVTVTRVGHRREIYRRR